MTKPKWYHYFDLSQNINLWNSVHVAEYVFVWKGTNTPVFEEKSIWRSSINAENWIEQQDWQKIVDEKFEKEVLGGS